MLVFELHVRRLRLCCAVQQSVMDVGLSHHANAAISVTATKKTTILYIFLSDESESHHSRVTVTIYSRSTVVINLTCA